MSRPFPVKPSQFLTRSATHIKRRVQLDGNGQPVTDEYGKYVYTETSVTRSGLAWDPRLDRKTEDTDKRETVEWGYDVYDEDVDADVVATDQFILDDGLLYQVDGPVLRYSGSATVDYATYPLKRTVG